LNNSVIKPLCDVVLKHFSLKTERPEWAEAARRVRLQLLKERAEAREAAYSLAGAEGDPVPEPNEGREAEIKRLTALLRDLRRDTARKYKVVRLEALRESWHERDFATMHKVARQLATTSVGTKKRIYTVMNPAAPTRPEWLSFLALPGALGGLAAEEISPPLEADEGEQPPRRRTTTHATGAATTTT